MANLIDGHIAEASTRVRNGGRRCFARQKERRRANRRWRFERARPGMITETRFERMSAATHAANAAGEGHDGAGGEESPAPRPMLKAPSPRAAPPTAADLGLLEKPTSSRQRKFRLGWRRRARLSCRRLDGPGRGRRPPFGARVPEEEDSDGRPRGWMIQIGAPDDSPRPTPFCAAPGNATPRCSPQPSP